MFVKINHSYKNVDSVDLIDNVLYIHTERKNIAISFFNIYDFTVMYRYKTINKNKLHWLKLSIDYNRGHTNLYFSSMDEILPFVNELFETILKLRPSVAKKDYENQMLFYQELLSSIVNVIFRLKNAS